MTASHTDPASHATEPDSDKHFTLLLPTYLDWQYKRIGQLEEHGLAVSGAVIALSVAVLTFLARVAIEPEASKLLTALTHQNVLLLLLLANIAAILYIARVIDGQNMHENRVKDILARYASSLQGISSRPGRRFKWRIRPLLQSFVHVVVAFIILLMPGFIKHLMTLIPTPS